MANLDRLERLTDLVLVLLHARTPRTLEDIASSVPGYPASPAARRQAFERDKRILREEGIPVLTEHVEGREQYGYRIDPETFYLPDLGLTPDEQAALHLAVAGVHLGDPRGRDALSKLGASGVADARPVAQIAAPEGLVALFDAVRSQSEVRFTYHGMPRAIAPATLHFRGGRWYLVGWDRERAADRTFRIDRIEALAAPGPPGSGALPAGPRSQALEPWRGAEADGEQVLVRVDGVVGPRVVAEVGEGAVVERGDDGSALLRLGVSSFDVLRSWVLALLDHAEIVGPPAARSSIVHWLGETLRAAQAGQPAGAMRGTGKAPTRGEGRRMAPASASVTSATVTSATGRAANARLRRLLAVVAWLAEAREASIGELSERFDIAPEELVRELELAACCGVPPYSPDALLEIVVSDERVQASLPKELARPRRLTPSEGLALAASARTILAVPGADRDGALGRALAKLESVLGDHRRLVIQLDTPPLLDEARAVVAAGVQAEILYHSASSDVTTQRLVDPIEVVSLDGHWYLDAYCQRAGGVRRFRVDRILELRPLASPASPGAERPGDAAFVPGGGSEEVVVEIDKEAGWVADSVPVLARRELPGTGAEITLAVGGRAWLEGLLLQAGPHARVTAPEEFATVGPAAASRLLRRYDAGGGRRPPAPSTGDTLGRHENA